MNMLYGVNELTFAMYHYILNDFINELKYFLVTEQDQIIENYRTAKNISSTDVNVMLKAYQLAEFVPQIPY